MKTKILVFFITLSLLVSFSFAQVATAAPANEALAQTIRQQIQDVKAKIIQLQKQLEDMKAESETAESENKKIQKKTINITVDGLVPLFETREGYDIIEIDGYDFTHEISAPVLPVKNFSFVVPEGITEIKNIKVVSSEKEVLRGEFNIYPAQQPVPSSKMNDKDDLPDFDSPNPSIYKSSNAYPGRLLKYTGDGYLRDYHILSFNFYPVQYNPAGKKATLYKNIDIEITYTVLSTESKKKIKQDEFSTMAKGMVNNPEDVEELSVETTEAASEVLFADDVEYLIVTKEFLKSEFQVLLDHKTGKGLTGKIVLLSWIKDNYTGKDTQEQIRNFLKEAEATWNTKWVLLGGDTNVVPHRLIYSQWNPLGYEYGENVQLPADIYYSGLDGNTAGAGADLYPDVFVGRAPVDTISETQTFVNKTIAYEKGPAGYEATALFLGDSWAEATNKLIKRKSLPKYFSLTELYNCGISPAMEELNLGYGIVNHLGHSYYHVICLTGGCGQYNRLGLGHIVSLTNSSRNPLFYGAGCWSNAMDYDSIAERFVTNPNGGAVAYIGNSRYGISYPNDLGNGPSASYNKSFFNSLFNKGITNLGQAFADSKLALAPSCSHPADCSNRYLQYGLNLLGDPEMTIWTSKTSVPSKLSVTATSVAKVNNGSQFVVDAEISYYGEDTATGVEAVLTLPAELSTSETLTKPIGNPIGDMLPGHLAKVSWIVNADAVGTYNITVTATAANVGSASNTTAVQVMIPDLTPPTIALQSPENNATSGDDVNVVFKYIPTDAQGISKCELIINGSIYATDDEITEGAVNEFSELIAAGAYTWKVSCVDDSPDTNKGASESRSLTVEDRTPPTDGSIIIKDINNGYTNNPLPELQILAIGADDMAFSCNNSTFTGWTSYAESYSFFNMETGAGCALGDGEKTIYVKFKDEAGHEDEGVHASDTTMLDTASPIITSIIGDIKSMSATITWTTDELTNTVVNYGTETPLTQPTPSKSNASFVKFHSITLTELSPDTKYFYEVKSSDIAGNSVVDNNGGLYYTFTTMPAEYMHVESIDMTTTKVKSVGWYTYATAVVTIVDVGGSPVEGATISGSWTHPNGGYQARTMTTGSNGKAATNSWSVKNARGTFTFRVDNVTKSDWIYDSSANNETSDSIPAK